MIAYLKRYLFFGLACLLVILAIYFGAKREADPVSMVSENHVSTAKVERRREVRKEVNQSKSPVIPEAKPLSLPPSEMPKSGLEVAYVQRELVGDDAILAAGGLIERKAMVSEDTSTRTARLKSILAKDWEGRGNLLVNELRAGNGFEVSLDQVEAFLRGKDLYGWPEGQRNWIGDEMMTILRQELPANAYEILSKIQADESAPAAMRDYSIQHISHLVADGHVGNEGVAIIRAALESGNTATASTALISLHRLSEKVPNLLAPAEIMSYAKNYENSSDSRLQITARSILDEGR